MRGTAPGTDHMGGPGFVGHAGGFGFGPSHGAAGQMQPQPQLRPQSTATIVNNEGIFPSISTSNHLGDLLTLTSGIHVHNMKNAFSALLSTGYASTVKVNCKGVEFPVHRFILQNCSGYFCNQFADSDEVKEDSSSDVNVNNDGAGGSRSNVIFLNHDEISPEIFKHILEYMYVGQLTLSKDKLPEFFKAGEILKVKGLYKKSDQSQTQEAEDDGEGNREEKDKTKDTSNKEGEGQRPDRLPSPMLPRKPIQLGLICDPPPRPPPRPPVPVQLIHPRDLALLRMMSPTPAGGGFYGYGNGYYGGYGVPYPYLYQSSYLAQAQYQAFLAQQRAAFWSRVAGPAPVAANTNANVHFQRFANAPTANIPIYFGNHPRPGNLVTLNNGNETGPGPMMNQQCQGQGQHQQRVNVPLKQEPESESVKGTVLRILRQLSTPNDVGKSPGQLQEGHSQDFMKVKEDLKSDSDKQDDAKKYGGITISKILGPIPSTSIPQWSGLSLPVGVTAVNQGHGQSLQLPKPNAAPKEPKPAKRMRKN